MENRCANIINGKIIPRRTLRGLSAKDNAQLSMFIAVQSLRTRYYRESVSYMDKQIENELKRRGLDINNISNYRPFESEKEIKHFSLMSLKNIASNLVPHLIDKVWALYESNGKFIISDNPVGLQNTVNKSEYRGTLGFAVKGIEIYFPIGPSLTIELLCQDTFKELETTYKKHGKIKEEKGNFHLRNFVKKIRRKIPIECTKENILNLNSIQIVFAERFIFSNNDDFSLADKIIEENEKIRKGPRSEIK